ncbi:MAG: NAD(P)H-hydrate dehydratase [Patescibacteria group bacterium]
MIIDDSILDIYSQREEKAKKYDHGSVLIIGGSQIYSGSPAISGLAALRSGADIAQIIAPRRSADIVAGFSPDLITYPIEGKALESNDLTRLFEITQAAKAASRGNLAVVIGGGIGRKEETKELVRRYVKDVSVPVVVDADGIYAFEEEGEEFLHENCLFTPHLYEFSILTGKKVNNLSNEEKQEAVKEAAAEMGITIALKGAFDIVSDGSEVAINEFPVPELTAGGCGDSLAGIAGAILARTQNPMKAGMAAVYLNTKAGQLAANKKGESLIAEDLIARLSEAIRD